MVDNAAFGKRIKAARKNKGLTQSQLAEIIGIEPNTLSHIERGMTLGSVQSLVNIATALDITPNSLLADSLPEERTFYLGAIEKELESCSSQELRVVEETVRALVEVLHRQYSAQKE